MKTILKNISTLCLLSALVVGFYSCEDKELPPVSAASELKVDSISYKYAKLSWGGETGVYQILISANGEIVKDTVVSALKVAVFLLPETDYTWQVANINAGVKSDFVSGPAFRTVVQNPVNLNVTEITAISAKLSWTGYSTEYYQVVISGGDTTIVKRVLGTVLTADLRPNTTYSWNVTLQLPTYTSATAIGEEFTTSGLYSISDFIGNYSFSYGSVYEDPDLIFDGGIFSIEINPNVENGVILKDFYIEGSEIEAEVDLVNGKLLVPDVTPIELVEDDGDEYLLVTYNLEIDGPIEFILNDDKTLVCASMFGVVAANPNTGALLGYWDKFINATFTPEGVSSGVPARIKASKKSTNSIKPMLNKKVKAISL
ncbi:MAG: fibronectin type III domain-containing protein [Paludibacter sp.]|jgi:hypothetical protein|nr:fibronectin type III domain-containing protein [Paludibacter sp.]